MQPKEHFSYRNKLNSPKMTHPIVYIIEEVWRKKPRQTDVVILWGKIAAHMLLFRLCSRVQGCFEAWMLLPGG